MTYSNQTLESINTGEDVFCAEASASARNLRRRRRAQALSYKPSGLRIIGFGI